jgi:succinate dehydrogenase/fumarate reductase flavoprotein subunit
LCQAAKMQVDRVDELLARHDGVPQHEIRNRLKRLFTEKVGIYRSRQQLSEALGELLELRAMFRRVGCRSAPGPFQSEIVHVLELEGMLRLGEITIRGALAREESRGSHFRTDFPKRDDARWLKHTVAELDGDDVVLSYTDVDISHHEPQERTY